MTDVKEEDAYQADFKNKKNKKLYIVLGFIRDKGPETLRNPGGWLTKVVYTEKFPETTVVYRNGQKMLSGYSRLVEDFNEKFDRVPREELAR